MIGRSLMAFIHRCPYICKEITDLECVNVFLSHYLTHGVETIARTHPVPSPLSAAQDTLFYAFDKTIAKNSVIVAQSH